MILPNLGFTEEELIDLFKKEGPITIESIAKVIAQNNQLSTTRLATSLQSLRNELIEEIQKTKK